MLKSGLLFNTDHEKLLSDISTAHEGVRESTALLERYGECFSQPVTVY